VQVAGRQRRTEERRRAGQVRDRLVLEAEEPDRIDHAGHAREARRHRSTPTSAVARPTRAVTALRRRNPPGANARRDATSRARCAPSP
jgi:hypothetical protein